MFTRRNLIWIGPLAILAIAGFVALGGELVRLLWNAVLPPLFGWREITFWQALAILVLCRVLFGGSPGGGFRSGMRRRMSERMDQMTPEERERFREGIRGRCGLARPADENKPQSL